MSVWSDPRVIELAKQFVPATDEVWRLQRGSDPECSFFQVMADQGHYGGSPGTSRQGTYICAPSGEFLASINSNNADRVLETMRQGLQAWQELPAEKKQLDGDAAIKPMHRWEDSFPTDGLTLNMFTRDLPKVGGPDQACAVKWNQDRVWFSKAEARRWLPATIQDGEVYQIPEDLVSRLVRLHLVDTVLGQSDPFSSRDIQQAELLLKITHVDDSLAAFEISGATRTEAPGRGRNATVHGVETKLLGSGKFDLRKEMFTSFELVAVGKRWGATTFNGRRRQQAESPVGFVFRLASPDEPRIAPAFISSYRVDWVKRPASN